MNTLEEEIIIPLQRQMAAQQAESQLAARFRLGPALLVAGLSLLLGILVAGLMLMKNEFGNAWRQGVASYDWVVMAEGDSVAIDEVGRFLKKLDGVADVSYVSADDVLEKARADSALAADLALLETNPFPAGWVVHWKADEFDPVKIQDAHQDVISLPGVVDIASDPRALEKIHLFRTWWLRVKLALAVGMTALVILLCGAIGRLLFVPWPKWLTGKTLAAGVVTAVLSGAAGAALLFVLW